MGERGRLGPPRGRERVILNGRPLLQAGNVAPPIRKERMAGVAATENHQGRKN